MGFKSLRGKLIAFEEVVENLLRIPQLLEIVIVDDASSDSTPEVARLLAVAHPEVRVVRLDRNRGKTHALKTGFKMTSGEIVIVQDAVFPFSEGAPE